MYLRGTLVIAGLLALSGCAPQAPPAQPAGDPLSQEKPAEPVTLTYGILGITWASTWEMVAQDKGFFAEEKLTVESSLAGQSSAGVCQQVLAKAAQLGTCSINDMIQAVEAGNAPLIQFIGIYTAPLNYSVMAKPNVKSWLDLKGKNVMVGGPKDNTVFFFHEMARPNGLKDSDYDFQYAGSSGSRYAALKAGAVDATIITDPFDFQAEQDGFTKLDVMVPKYVSASNYGYSAHVVRSDWAKEHPDQVVRFIRAYFKAVSWLHDPGNKEELFRIVTPKLNMSRESFERIYKRDVVDSKFFFATGQITDAGVRGVLKSLVELGSLKEPTPAPSKFYDMTYANKALESLKR